MSSELELRVFVYSTSVMSLVLTMEALDSLHLVNPLAVAHGAFFHPDEQRLKLFLGVS